ncbi:ATP-binding cassette domain-containing protein [Dactylosporangium matsuzakiense]|uniref:Daunorubicin resistance protein DrrA family ABC transporter ATP-binding protein n=1 Tax=Dactylosporangium matsuzakiense TaxID=53360 RepID=A0A9W6KTV8_9ACTN|nr:ATP-binding cassette domain-containing protein [Dactylosporangium matsuzakiense]UWZ46474.1 ATP-binding cassette domain-containing protein [Dactylosporangium matsuzakiense]GLL06604.1 daunorubicin resistance protein DrrA family ABC transporter ATP-binding protein [Dactylosporangium matsuzakiense]
MTNSGITVSGLRKSYGDQVVLDGLDLDVPAGAIFSLLGPNGAGKTTMVHILATLIPPDGGTAAVAGHDLATEPAKVRAAIGLTGQFSAVDSLLTGEENLLLMADLLHLPRRAGRDRARELLERFELTGAAKRTPATYSGGMKRRLDLAMTLVGNPRVIFLDEPTTGLDPRSRRTVWEIVRDLAKGGVTIFLTTQYLDEADQLADQVAVLDQGRIVASGTPDALKRRVPGAHVRLVFSSSESLRAAAVALPTAARDDEALVLQVPTDGTPADLRSLLVRLETAGVDPDALTVHTPDLDDVFFALTGHATKEPVS